MKKPKFEIQIWKPVNKPNDAEETHYYDMSGEYVWGINSALISKSAHKEMRGIMERELSKKK